MESLFNSISLLCHHWENVANYIGLTSFQFIVVSGMVISGMMIKWTFQQEKNHHHD